MRGSERLFLGTTVIFLKKLQMCLQMKNTLGYGRPVPRKWISVACSQMERPRQELCLLCQMNESSQTGKTAVTCFFSFFFKDKFIYLFIYFWLHWVFVAVHGLSLVVASGGYSSMRCTSFSLRWLLLLQSMGSRHAGFSSCGAQAQ